MTEKESESLKTKIKQIYSLKLNVDIDTLKYDDFPVVIVREIFKQIELLTQKSK